VWKWDYANTIIRKLILTTDTFHIVGTHTNHDKPSITHLFSNFSKLLYYRRNTHQRPILLNHYHFVYTDRHLSLSSRSEFSLFTITTHGRSLEFDDYYTRLHQPIPVCSELTLPELADHLKSFVRTWVGDENTHTHTHTHTSIGLGMGKGAGYERDRRDSVVYMDFPINSSTHARL
jgi:hypothetical protein